MKQSTTPSLQALRGRLNLLKSFRSRKARLLTRGQGYVGMPEAFEKLSGFRDAIRDDRIDRGLADSNDSAAGQKPAPSPTFPTKNFDIEHAAHLSHSLAKPSVVPSGTSRSRILALLTWINAGSILLMLIWFRLVGASFWGTSLLLLVPRWPFLCSTAVLALFSIPRGSRRLWPTQAASALAVLGPLMGFSMPIQKLLAPPPAGETIRVVSYNLGVDPIDRRRWIDWMIDQKIDVILLQEPFASSTWLSKELESKGWKINKSRTIATRLRIVDQLPSMRDKSAKRRRYSAPFHRERLETPHGRKFVVGSVHLPTLRSGIKNFLETYRAASLVERDAWWGLQLARFVGLATETADEPMLLGGDFNLPSDDSRLSSLHSLFRFAFDEAGWGYGYTRPSKHAWVRIDHILSTPDWYVKACWIGPDFGSDHLPIVAEFVLPRSRSCD